MAEIFAGKNNFQKIFVIAYTVIRIIISMVDFFKNILYKKTCHENSLSDKCKII